MRRRAGTPTASPRSLAGPAASLRLAYAFSALAPRLRWCWRRLLLYWQVNAPLADFGSTASDPPDNATYYPPLLAELRTLGVGYGRAPGADRGRPDARPRGGALRRRAVMLARGWERQLDR